MLVAVLLISIGCLDQFDQYSVGLDVGGILARNHQWMCRYTFLNV